MNAHNSQPINAKLDLVDHLRGRQEEVEAAYRETERLLRSPPMLSEYRHFRKAIILSTRRRLKEVIKAIADCGLVTSGGAINPEVEPTDLLEILEDEELSNSLQFAVRCSKETGNSHWNDSQLEQFLPSAVYGSTSASGNIDGQWEAESPEDEGIVGRVPDGGQARPDTTPTSGPANEQLQKAYWKIAAAVLLICAVGYGAISELRLRRLTDENSKFALSHSRLETEVSEKAKRLSMVEAELDSSKSALIAERERHREAVRLAQQERWRRLSNPVVTPIPAVGPPSETGVELTHDVIVNLDKHIGPDTFTKVEVCWDFDPNKVKPGRRPNEPRRDFNDWETLYYWRSTPLTPSVEYRYEHDANQPPRSVTTVFRYWPVDNVEVRKNLGLSATDDKLVRSFTIESRPEGIVWNKAIVPDETQVALSPAEVSADGQLSVNVAARRGSADRDNFIDQTTLHVVLRAKDGSGPWEPGPHSRYVVVGERIALADLGSEQVSRVVGVDLLSMFGSPELQTDVLPSEVEVLVVALPFDIGRTIVTSREFDDAIVLDSVTARWPRTEKFN
jgi:hypothetical protein